MKPSPQPAPRPLRTWTVRVAVALAATLMAAMATVSTSWFSDWVARVAEAAASVALGEDVVLGNLHVEPGLGRATLDGLVISHRSEDPARAGQAIVAADAIVVELGLRGWQPVARRISVERPFVHLHLDPDGLREFRRARRAETPLEAFPWEELWLRDGRVRLSAGATEIDLEGVSLTPESSPGRLFAAVDTVQVDVNGWRQRAERVAVSGLSLTPKRLTVPQIGIQTAAAQVEGALDLTFGEEISGQVAVDVALDELAGLIPSHLRLEGQAGVEVEVSGAVRRPQVKGAVLVEEGAVYRHRPGEGEVLMVEVDQLASGLGLSERVVRLDDLRSAWSGGRVRGSATFALDSKVLVATLEGEDLSLHEVFRHTGVSDAAWVDLQTDAEAHVAGTLKPLFLAGTLEVAGRDLQVASGPVRSSERLLSLRRLHAQAEIRAKDQYLYIGAHRIDTGRSRGSAVAEMDLGPQRSLDMDLDLHDLSLDEMRPLVDLAPRGRASISGRLAGPMEALSFSGSVDARELGLLGWNIASELHSPLLLPRLDTIQLTDIDARLGQSGLRGRVEVLLGAEPTWLDLQVLLREGRIEDLVHMVAADVDVSGAAEGTLSVQGPAEALDGEISLALADVDLLGERFATGRADAWMNGGRITLDRVEVRRGAEGALLRGRLEPDGAINLDVHTSGLSLARLDHLRTLGWNLDGQLSLSAQIGGTLSAPEPNGEVAVRRALLGGRVIGDSVVRFDTEGDTMGFTGSLGGPELDVAGTVQLGGEGAWALQADLDGFPAHMFYPQTPDGTPVRAAVTGQLVGVGEWNVEGAPFQIDATAESVFAQWGRRHRLRSQGPWTLKWSDAAFSLSGVELRGGQTRVAFGGARTEGGQILLAGDGVIDVDLFRAVVPGLERAEGRAQVDVSLTGERGALVPVVDLRLEDGRFDATWLPEPIEGAVARVSGRSSGYTLSGIEGRMGGGRLTAGGTIDAKDWRPVRYDLTGALRDTRVRYFEWLPPISGTAELDLTGPSEDPLLKGRIEVTDLLFADRIDWEDAVVDLAGERLMGATAEESADLFNMDIQLVADESIRVRNNLGDLVASGEMRVVGDTARPGLVGDLRALPGGRVYLKEREFELVRGELHFVEPYAFDPELDIALSTEVRTREDDYAIDYRLSGPWSGWRAESSSDPSLPEADINALLLFGMTRAELERYGGALSALALEGGDLLASKFGIVETLGEGIYGIEFLRPERIDLVSGVTERGSGTISSELRILAEKDYDWATVLFEQNLSRFNDRYLALERRLANRLYLRGFWAQQQVGRNLAIGGAWGLDFNLRWEVD